MAERAKKDTFIIKQKEVSNVVTGLFKKADIPTDYKVEQKWSEVDELYESIGQGLVDIGHSINDSIKTIREANIKDTTELTITINGLTRDIDTFSKELLAIRKRHEGMEGIVKDGDELALCLGVFNDYVILNDRFRAMVFPAMLTVTEYVSEAIRLNNIAKEQAQNQEATSEEQVETKEEKVNVNE